MELMEIVSLPEAESTRVEDNMSHAESDPFFPHAESTQVEDTSHAEPDLSLPDATSTQVKETSHAAWSITS